MNSVSNSYSYGDIPFTDLLLLTGAAGDFVTEGLEANLLDESSAGFDADFCPSSKSGLAKYSSNVLTRDSGAYCRTCYKKLARWTCSSTQWASSLSGASMYIHASTEG